MFIFVQFFYQLQLFIAVFVLWRVFSFACVDDALNLFADMICPKQCYRRDMKWYENDDINLYFENGSSQTIEVSVVNITEYLFNIIGCKYW